MPLALLPQLVTILRRVPGLSICIGNNAFSFNAFYTALQAANALDLFNVVVVVTHPCGLGGGLVGEMTL